MNTCMPDQCTNLFVNRSPVILGVMVCLASQIFFNSEHLGGNDDIQKLHKDGKLEALAAKVRQEAPGMMKPTWYHPWY